MKPVRVSPLEGLLQLLASGFERPSEQITDKIGSITIDTSLPSDTHIWETGIKRMSIEGKWGIVEQYPNKTEAEIGHKKWTNLMTEFPDYPIKDIDNWNLGEIPK